MIYKRNTTGDWSQFSEVFGMPIQEYTYDSDDEGSRERAISDAANVGSLATFVHGQDTSLNLIEAGNKTGSADVYERLCERCNNEISKLFLGNTLTTESSDTGTQALGTVHKKGEDKIAQSDRLYVLDVLNYEAADIFARMGIYTTGGEFCFPEKKDLDPTSKINILTQLCTGFNLPVDDDYLYEEFGISKPANYEMIKKEEQERRAREAEEAKAAAEQIPQNDGDTEDDPDKDNNPENGEQGDDKDLPEPTEKQKKDFQKLAEKFFRKSPVEHRGGFRMVVDGLYYDKDTEVASSFDFSDETLRNALLNIYSKDFHPASDIEVTLFNEVWATMDKAVKKAFGNVSPSDPDADFIEALRRNNAVFSAFKVHRAQNDMARLLLDSNGNPKPFEQWLNEVMPIASHQCRTWLKTEYDTAVIRAHQAADWRQFSREKDILPNLNGDRQPPSLRGRIIAYSGVLCAR